MTVLSKPSPDRPHWTEPVSRDETLARLEESRESGWLDPVWKENTIICVQVAERYWKKQVDPYCDHVQADYVDLLLRCEPAVFQNWIDWIIRTSKPKTKDTYRQYWKWLSEYYQFWAKKAVDNSTLKQMNRYINGQMLVDHQVSLRARRKETLSAEDLGILLRWHWMYDTAVYTHERLRVQMALLMLFSAFTGTRPGVMLPQSGSTKMLSDSAHSADRPKKRKPNSKALKSDLPVRMRVSRRPTTICYRDIELYLLRNPDSSKRDVFVAEIEFVNLKGLKEGADGTIFLMHEDAQLAYCPITHILALAFADDAFESPQLTPEFLCQLKVPKRLHSLPLRWKKSKLNVPLFRHPVQTEYGIRIHPTLPMKYDTSNSSIKDLGEAAGYRYPIQHYCFRRWTANEANRAFTSEERNRILGHSGNRIFEKHYHDKAIRRDIQSVVLLRPSQEALCQAAAQMTRNRDPLAPSGLTNNQLEEIRRLPRIVNLRNERNALKINMKWQNGSVKKAQALGTDLSQRHAQVVKEIARVRAAHRREAQINAKEEYHDAMPTIEIEKQISRLKQTSDLDCSDGEDEEWSPSIPEYAFEERARIAEAFWGPEAETLVGTAALTRRAQAIRDLSVLCERREPSSRGQRFNWNKDDDDDDDKQAMEADLDPLQCPRDQCIFCLGDQSLQPARPRKFARVDSLRRHLEKVHLNLISEADLVRCPHPACKEMGPLDNVNVFLNHAARVHDYDLRVQPRRS